MGKAPVAQIAAGKLGEGGVSQVLARSPPRLPPDGPEAVDWGRCAVILPERDAGARALQHMAAMPEKERCRRRNYCYFGIYKQYAKTFPRQVLGYIEGLEGF